MCACSGAFNPSAAVQGSLVTGIGQLQKTATVELSPTDDYLLLVQADKPATAATAVYTLTNFGEGSAGLPGVSTYHFSPAN